jgi:hypothetical protein
MANAKDTKAGNGNTSSAEEPKLVDWQGERGGSIDGWWAPKPGDILKGIPVNFIPKSRSDKLQSDTIVFELQADCPNVKNGGSDKMPGKKGDDKLHTAGKGCIVGVPVWSNLEGMWPKNAGFYVKITAGEKRSIGGGKTMYTHQIQMSEAAVRVVQVYSQDAVSAPVEADGETPQFRAE